MNNHKPTILIVDDLPSNIDVLKKALSNDYSLRAATSGALALKILDATDVDLILLDVMMPEMDGYETCKRIKANPRTHQVPVIFVTALTDSVNEEQGLSLGAVDFITKPITPAIVRVRIKNHLELADQQKACQKKVIQRTAELVAQQKSAIHMLGEAGHYNDTDTGLHIWRMAEYAAILARAANWPCHEVDLLKLAAPMHDTGKIGIVDSILKAPRRLTDEEMDIMKLHTTIGHKILSKSDSELFKMAADIALYHHEKWNGQGYPESLKTTAIPESARITAIADVFDALTMIRPYKDAWPVEDAFQLIEDEAGKHFDPTLTALFLEYKEEILEAKRRWDSTEFELDK